MRKLKVIHLGTGPRSVQFILPILAQLSDQLELLAIYGRSPEKVEPLARQYSVPGYTDLEQMLDRHPADMATAIVNCSANYALAEPLARRGISCILETPIELDLAKAHALLELAASHKVRIEIAENSFRFPDERLARKLLDEGLFGRVLVAYNDMGTHGYHAINRLRNYVGFAEPIKSVTAFHQTWGGKDRSSGTRMSFIEFANAAVGVHSIGYGLAVNPWPVHKKFVAERGWLACQQGEYLDGQTKRAIRIERVGRGLTDPTGKSVDVCQQMVADLGGGKKIVWTNPLADRAFDDEHLSAAAVVQSMARAVRENVAQEYALQDALIDYETDSAMCCSHAHARRVTLPLDLAAVAEDRRRGLY